MTINKSYSLDVETVSKFDIGKQAYLSLDIEQVKSVPFKTVRNESWHNNQTDGLSNTDYIDDQFIMNGSIGGSYALLNSFILKDGAYYYATDDHANLDILQNVVSFIRYKDQIKIYQYYNFVKESYLDENIISIDKDNTSCANLNGSKRYVLHSNEANYLSTNQAEVIDSMERHDPIIVSGKLYLKTDHFPIGGNIAVYAYDTGWTDVTNLIESVYQETGEIILTNTTATKLGVFYFLRPVAIGKSDIVVTKSSTPDYKFVEYKSMDTIAVIETNLSSNTLNPYPGSDKITLSIDNNNQNRTIELSSPLRIGNENTNSKHVNDLSITLSASTNIMDNMYPTAHVAGPDYSITINDDQDNIDVAVYGIFNYNNQIRLSALSVGTDDSSDYEQYLDGTYAGTLATSYSGSIAETTYLFDILVEVDFDKYGYEFALPSAVNIGTLVVTEYDLSGSTTFTDYTYFQPDVVSFDVSKIDPNKSYRITYTSFISPIIKEVEPGFIRLLTGGDPFVEYNTLTGLLILGKKTITITYSSTDKEGNSNYYLNSDNILLNVSKEYIAKTLGEYKSSLITI